MSEHMFGSGRGHLPEQYKKEHEMETLCRCGVTIDLNNFRFWGANLVDYGLDCHICCLYCGRVLGRARGLPDRKITITKLPEPIKDPRTPPWFPLDDKTKVYTALSLLHPGEQVDAFGMSHRCGVSPFSAEQELENLVASGQAARDGDLYSLSRIY